MSTSHEHVTIGNRFKGKLKTTGNINILPVNTIWFTVKDRRPHAIENCFQLYRH